jgi:hypothetical protein
MRFEPGVSRRLTTDSNSQPSPRLGDYHWARNGIILLLTSLRALQPDARALVIVLEAEVILVEGHQVVFEGCFENTNAGYMVTRLSDDIGHRLWLQGPLNHLGGERKANYIADIFRRILEFLHV